jgi:gliding motility-associated lipoprotein GldH
MLKNLAGLFILFLLISCNSSSGEVYMKSVNGKWDKKAVQKIDFEIKDAQNPKNIIFVVRNNNDFPYSNIRFIANFKDMKTKKVTVDTLNYTLANPNGEWVGSGFGDTKETLFQYKLDYKFPQNGKYEIGIIQAMRNDFLPGVEDIGIKIETAKP